MNEKAQSIINTASDVLERESAAIRAALLRLDSSFVKAVEIIERAPSVLVVGIGKSGLIASKIAATLSSINKPAHFLHPVEALHGDLGMAQAGCAVIVISKSGTTAEIVTLLPFLQQRAFSIIGLIGTKESYLARQVDICLDVSVDHEADAFNLVPTASTTLALAMGDALAMSLAGLTGFSPAEFAHHHPLGQLGRNLQFRVADVMHSGEALPLISPGESFRAALIVSSEHTLGCVCVVDTDGHLQGIITDGDVRRVLQTHDDIRQLRAADVMTAQPVCALPDMLLHEALAVMEQRQRQLSVLPVVDKEMLCIGVVRVHDIIKSSQD